MRLKYHKPCKQEHIRISYLKMVAKSTNYLGSCPLQHTTSYLWDDQVVSFGM